MDAIVTITTTTVFANNADSNGKRSLKIKNKTKKQRKFDELIKHFQIYVSHTLKFLVITKKTIF